VESEQGYALSVGFPQWKLYFGGLGTLPLCTELLCTMLLFTQIMSHKDKERGIGYPSFNIHSFNISALIFHEYFKSHPTNKTNVTK
jgi:hypothetical protein